MIVRKLWRWSFRRHLKKGKRWIKQRYFHSVDGNNWIFGTQLEEENAGQLFSLKRLCDKKIIKHIKICNDSNPYDPQWEVYYKKRHTQQMLEHFNGNRTILRTWENQMQRCPVCGEPLSDKTTWTLTHKMINGKKVKYLTHNKCCKITDTNKWKLLWAGFITETLSCLSRMRGNSHVRFLGGKAPVRELTYPAGRESTAWLFGNRLVSGKSHVQSSYIWYGFCYFCQEGTG